MSNEQEQPKKEIIYERVWETEGDDPVPDLEDVLNDAREAYNAAFGSPGKLRIRGVKRNC